MRTIITAGSGVSLALAIAGCAGGSDASSEPEPTVTVTATPGPTPEPRPTPELRWEPSLADDAMALRTLLVDNGFDCASKEQVHPMGGRSDATWIDCDGEHATTLHFEPRGADRIHPEEMWAPAIEDGKGVVWTDDHTIVSDDQEQLDLSFWVLQNEVPQMIDAD